MDIVINELLKLSRTLNVDNLMHKINEKNEELLLNDLQKTNLETEFKKIFLCIFDQDSKKRSQPDSGLAQGGSALFVQKTSQPFSSKQASSQSLPQPLLQQPSSQPQQKSPSQSLPRQEGYSYSQAVKVESTEKSGAGAGK
jgi:hypothetical protein